MSTGNVKTLDWVFAKDGASYTATGYSKDAYWEVAPTDDDMWLANLIMDGEIFTKLGCYSCNHCARQCVEIVEAHPFSLQRLLES